MLEEAVAKYRLRMGVVLTRDGDRSAERNLVEPGVDAPVDNAREKVREKISGHETERRQYPREAGRSEFRKRDDQAIGGDGDIRSDDDPHLRSVSARRLHKVRRRLNHRIPSVSKSSSNRRAVQIRPAKPS